MTHNEIVGTAIAMTHAAAGSGILPPFRILVPEGTSPGEHYSEGVTLEQRLKDIANVQEVGVNTVKGVGIESVRNGS